jgi:hypothetical protein
MAFDKKNSPKKSAISFPARMVNSKASGFFRIAKDFFPKDYDRYQQAQFERGKRWLLHCRKGKRMLEGRE